MVVWFAHVRVGHRQLSILKYPPTSYLVGGFSLSVFYFSYNRFSNLSFAELRIDSISFIQYLIGHEFSIVKNTDYLSNAHI